MTGLEIRAYALARLGRQEEALRIINQLQEEDTKGKPLQGAIGIAYIGRRDYDKAFDAFERSLAQDSIDDGISYEPVFDEIRQHPRFAALLKKAGLAN